MFVLAVAAFVLFCIDTLVNWAGNLLDKKALADNSKPLLMPLLALTAVLVLLKTSCPQTVILTLVVALAFHTAGDIFLLSDKDLFFMLGALCFLIGHVFYLTLFGGAFASVSTWFWIVMAIVLVAFAVVLFFSFKKKDIVMALGVPVYAAVLLTLAFAGLAGVITSYSKGSVFVLIGGVLFVASDAMLALSNFAKKFPGYKFWVMFTYVTAEFLLVLGAVKPYL